jgi:hypothetical protein
MLLQAPRLIIAGGATALNIQRKVDRGKIATIPWAYEQPLKRRRYAGTGDSAKRSVQN